MSEAIKSKNPEYLKGFDDGYREGHSIAIEEFLKLGNNPPLVFSEPLKFNVEKIEENPRSKLRPIAESRFSNEILGYFHMWVMLNPYTNSISEPYALYEDLKGIMLYMRYDEVKFLDVKESD